MLSVETLLEIRDGVGLGADEEIIAEAARSIA